MNITMKRTRLSVIILALIFIVVLFSGCSKGPTAKPSEPKVPEPGENIVDPNPSKGDTEIKLFFVNKDYILTGQGEMLKSETRVVPITKEHLAEVAIAELIKGPNTEGLSNEIPQNAKILSVEVVEGTAFVNFSSENLYGGSLQEALTINQIVYTLCELNDVNQVQFLIDGVVPESLMGHINVDQPIAVK